MVFESMQQTSRASRTVLGWLNGKLPTSVKASLPPFNKRTKNFNAVHMRTANVVKECINLPSFGLNIPKVVRIHAQCLTVTPCGEHPTSCLSQRMQQML